MKNLKIAISFIAVIAFLFSASLNAQNKYVGVKKCGMCHKSKKSGNQLKVWKASGHANAYKSLLTDEANKISQAKDKINAVDNKDCLSCHTTGYGVDAKLFDKKFKIEDGVQCETCHGPGSKFKSMKVMKNHADAVKKGLHEYKDEKAIEKMCLTCHDKSKSSTVKDFVFAERWAKIKHYKSKK